MLIYVETSAENASQERRKRRSLVRNQKRPGAQKGVSPKGPHVRSSIARPIEQINKTQLKKHLAKPLIKPHQSMNIIRKPAPPKPTN